MSCFEVYKKMKNKLFGIVLVAVMSVQLVGSSNAEKDPESSAKARKIFETQILFE